MCDPCFAKLNNLKIYSSRMSAHRAWWPSAPTTKAETLLSISPPPAPLPPQHLWPHHAIPGNSSPRHIASFESSDCTQNNHIAKSFSSSSSSQKNTRPQGLIEPARPLYAGIFLSGPSKHLILERYPPHHATIYAHHVTLQYFGYDGNIALDVAECSDTSFPIGSTVSVGVVGSAADDRCQAVEVTLPSWVQSQYGNTSVPPHVTVSVVEGGEARDAGMLLKERKMQGKIEPVHGLRVLHGIVGICLTDRRVVYSEEELREAVAFDGDDACEQGCGAPCGGDDESLPLPQPSSQLLGLAKEKKKNTTSLRSIPGVDLVSLLHRCFPPVDAFLPPAGHIASSSSSDAVHHTINIRRPNSRQLSIRSTPRNSNGTRSKRRSRSGTTPEASHSSIAVSARAWWKTSSVTKVTTSAATPARCTIQEGIQDEDPDQHHGITQIDAAFEVNLEAAENERAIMNAHHTAYKTAVLTSKRAKSAGNHTSARAHARTAHHHASAFLAARQRSSAAAFHAHNAAILNIFKLDLHGMHVKEAVTVLEKYVEGLGRLQHPGGVLLKVVTGFGRHSAIPGRAKVLPAVVEYLAEAGMLFDVEEENPGMVRVLLEHSRKEWL